MRVVLCWCRVGQLRVYSAGLENTKKKEKQNRGGKEKRQCALYMW